VPLLILVLYRVMRPKRRGLFHSFHNYISSYINYKEVTFIREVQDIL